MSDILYELGEQLLLNYIPRPYRPYTETLVIISGDSDILLGMDEPFDDLLPATKYTKIQKSMQNDLEMYACAFL